MGHIPYALPTREDKGEGSQQQTLSRDAHGIVYRAPLEWVERGRTWGFLHLLLCRAGAACQDRAQEREIRGPLIRVSDPGA